MDQEVGIQGIITQAYEALNAGLILAVLGWNSRWHSEWTRMAEHMRHAIFIDQVPKKIALGPNVGYVLYTYRIGHSEVQKIKRNHHKPIAPICTRPHQIHTLFREWCEEMDWSKAVRRRA